jgi:hypothetical protein
VNHDNTKVIGNIEDAEFEDGNIEYVGYINKQPYVDKMRDRERVRRGEIDEEAYFMKWNVYPINGVSIDAKYRYNRCVHCGERFTELDSWNTHMLDSHGVKTNLQEMPQGIVMDALSVVEPPETPGVESATIELMETVGGGLSRLLETVTRDNKTLEKMKKANIALRPEKHIAPPKPIKEQDEEPEACPEGQHRNEEGECVPDVEEQEDHECPEGKHWDAEKDGCVPDVTEQTEGDPIPAVKDVPVPEGQVKVSDDTPPEAAAQPECAEGSHFDKDLGICVPNAEVPPAQDVMPPPVSEIKLGEPIKGYSDFADCVAKNSDKADPEAYCASIEHKAEPATETYALEQYKITQKQTNDKIDKDLRVIKHAVREYAKDLTKIKAGLAVEVSDKAKIAKTLTDTQQNLRSVTSEFNKILTDIQESFSKQWRIWETSVVNLAKQVNRVEARKQFDSTPLTKMLTELQNRKPYDPTKLNDSITQINETIAAIQEDAKKAKDSYETILGSIDEKYKEYKVDMEKRLEEAKKESKEQKVEETVKLETRVDNLEDKLKDHSQFKGQVKKKETK